MKKRTLVEIGVGVTAFVLIGLFHTQMIAAAMIATGRSPKCPWNAAISSVSLSKWQDEQTRHNQAQSKLIEKGEDGTELWETPNGRFWIPKGSSEDVAYDLA